MLPCRGRRISITIRFFKSEVIERWRADMAKSAGAREGAPIEAAAAAAAVSERTDSVRIVLVDGKSNARKPLCVNPAIDEKELRALFRNKFRFKPSALMREDGSALVGELQEGAVIVGK